MTITDDVVTFIATAEPPAAAMSAAAEHLAAIRAAIGREDVAVKRAHPAGRPTAMNVAWRMAITAASVVHSSDAPGWPMTASAVIALQQGSAADDEAAADAVAIGTAVAARVVAALDSTAVADRWSRVGVAGVIGAGAAAGRLLRLDPIALRNLVGLCATQAAGLRAVDDTRAGVLQAAKAAADAVEAGVLAQSGFTSSVDGFGGRRGLLALLAPGADWSEGDGPTWPPESDR
jgi:2-methylcitrate dehydratase PrpD